MALPQDAQSLEDVAHDARHLGLADAGRTGEHHVLAHRADLDALRAPLGIHQDPRHHGLHLLLDRGEPDHRLEAADDPARLLHVDRAGALAAEGGGDVRGLEPVDVAAGMGGEPHRLGLSGLLQHRAHLAGIGPIFGAGAGAHIGDQLLLEALRQDEALVGRHALQDLGEFRRAVGRELDRLGEAAGETRIGVDEPTHVVGVAGHDHDDPVAVVLHELQQGIDRLLAEIAAA